MEEARFSAAWDVIAKSPQNAEILKLKSLYMVALITHFEHRRCSPRYVAKTLAIKEDQASRLLEGYIDDFSLSQLTAMVGIAKIYIPKRFRQLPSPASKDRKAA